MIDISTDVITGPKTTKHSESEGRLKVGVGNKQKIIKKLLKKRYGTQQKRSS